MKTSFIVKFALGLILVIVLIVVCYKLIDVFAGIITNIGGSGEIIDDSGDYEIETPEPMPTMPAYMGEDSFYDSAQHSDLSD